MKSACCILQQAGYDNKFWANAVYFMNYVGNQALTKIVENSTPFELISGHKPDISNLRFFSCPAAVLIQTQLSKLASKINKCLCIGPNQAYSSGIELCTTGRQLTLRCRPSMLKHRRSMSGHRPVLISLIDALMSTVDAPMSTLFQVNLCTSIVDAYTLTEELTLSPSSPTHPHSHTQVR